MSVHITLHLHFNNINLGVRVQNKRSTFFNWSNNMVKGCLEFNNVGESLTIKKQQYKKEDSLDCSLSSRWLMGEAAHFVANHHNCSV